MKHWSKVRRIGGSRVGAPVGGMLIAMLMQIVRPTPPAIPPPPYPADAQAARHRYRPTAAPQRHQDARPSRPEPFRLSLSHGSRHGSPMRFISPPSGMYDGLATARSALNADCLVAALCLDCNRPADLNLDELARRGFAGTPLIQLPLRCQQCGGANCRVIMPGRPYR